MQISPSDLQALLGILREFDPVKLTHEVATLGERWADEDAAASALEETRKTVLAKLTLEYLESRLQSGGPGEKPRSVPVNQAELKALADPRYEEHLRQMVAARQEANRSRVAYDMGKMRLELMRSLQATMRQEMRFSSHG